MAVSETAPPANALGEPGTGPLEDRLARVMAAAGMVPKTHKHPHFGYMYAGVEEIMAAVRGTLSAERVVLVPSVKSWDRNQAEPTRRSPTMTTFIEMRYQFRCRVDGELQTLDVDWSGEADDQQDKGLGKAYTMARKTFLRDFFLIVIGDEQDTDREHPKGSEAKGDVAGEAATPMSSNQRKAIFAKMTDALKRDDEPVDRDVLLRTLKMLVVRASSGRYTLSTYPGTKTAQDALSGWITSLKDDPEAVRADLRGYFQEHPDQKPPKDEPDPPAGGGATPPNATNSEGSHQATPPGGTTGTTTSTPSSGDTPPSGSASPTGTSYRPPARDDVASRDERIAYRVLAIGEEPASVDASEKVSPTVRKRAVKKYADAHADGAAPWHTPGPVPADDDEPPPAPSTPNAPADEWGAAKPAAEQFDDAMNVLVELRPNIPWAARVQAKSQELFEKDFDQLDDESMLALVAQMRSVVGELRARDAAAAANPA